MLVMNFIHCYALIICSKIRSEMKPAEDYDKTSELTFNLQHGSDGTFALRVFSDTCVLAIILPLHIVDLQWPICVYGEPRSF